MIDEALIDLATVRTTRRLRVVGQGAFPSFSSVMSIAYGGMLVPHDINLIL